MKKNTHPPYQKVLFVDSASGHRFVCGSTLQTKATEKFEGVEYPVSYLSISSSSHPFFTGSKQMVDSEGRVQKFNKRFGTKATVARAVVEVEEKEVKKPVKDAKAPVKDAKAPVKDAKAPVKPAVKEVKKPASDKKEVKKPASKSPAKK